jgi:hypothetical protein
MKRNEINHTLNTSKISMHSAYIRPHEVKQEGIYAEKSTSLKGDISWFWSKKTIRFMDQ